jgi:hypothetical protein
MDALPLSIAFDSILLGEGLQGGASLKQICFDNRFLDFASEAFKKIVRAGRYDTRSLRRTDRLRVGHLVNVVCVAD